MLSMILVPLAATHASGDTMTVPRGVLTAAEYRELLQTERALGRLALHGDPRKLASQACSALTDISTLTTTQRRECVASVKFIYAFGGFVPAFKVCGKKAPKSTERRCLEVTVRGLHTSTIGFLQADDASSLAAHARGLTGRCLRDLVFTASQKRVVARLATTLGALDDQLRRSQTDPSNLPDARLSADLTAAAGALMIPSTVKSCPHQ